MEKSKFCNMIDRFCQQHPECENYHDTKVALCKEFLETTRDMQGTELEPYLAEMKCTMTTMTSAMRPPNGC